MRGIAALREAHTGETVVLVSHAVVTRLIVLAALGLGPERLWSVDVSPAGISELDYRDEADNQRAFAAENIFQPLNMSHTLYRDSHTLLVPNRALAYDPIEKGTG
jgi:broad specificity phosphatase PhoE